MSKKPLKIGITGGIGSGKTTICKVFEILGAPVYNADNCARTLMEESSSVKKKIISEFGAESYNPDGSLNSKYISGLVFNDSDRLELLNNIVHPEVGEDFNRWVEKHQDHPYLIKEAALMFEAGSNKDMNRMITVFCPKELRIKRVLQRDTYRKQEDVERIMEKQMPDEKKCSLSDHVIFNDNENMVVPQVMKLDELFKLLYENQPQKK